MKDGQTIGQWLNWDFKANEFLIIKNKNDNLIYDEDSGGFWRKREYNSQGNQIYLENSIGEIVDNRTPEIIVHNKRKYQLIP
jgi:hypothetical protein